jgi:tetratricopeptide (TPR) repeat protein
MTLSTGARLGPYEILAPLGAGGMGEVYKALDTRLQRAVAVKVLPAEVAGDPDRLRRFEQEARAVAALPVAEAVDLGGQIAQALAAAHGKHIVHRDLKPANVFLTTDRQVKLLDFGVAKLVAPTEADTEAPTVTARDATEMGMRLGTAGYMAPEQVRGLAVDARADLFAFGAVLYEMLAGRRAFVGDTAADTLSAILMKEPAPLTGPASAVPASLQAIVIRCLEKRAEDRFQTARDLGFALQAVASPSRVQPCGAGSLVGLAARTGPSLVALGRAGGRARPRRAGRYRGDAHVAAPCPRPRIEPARAESHPIPCGIAARGPLRRPEPGVLCRRHDRGAHRRPGEDLVTPQEQARLATVRQVKPEAYNLYLMGRSFFNSGSVDDLPRGLDYFRRAIIADPTYAPAHAWLSLVSSSAAGYGVGSWKDAAENAKAAGIRAVELDDSLADAHVALGNVATLFDRAWALAEREYSRALVLSPNDGNVLGWHGFYLTIVERHDEGIVARRRAFSLDPLSAQAKFFLAWSLYYAGRYDESIRLYLELIERDPKNPQWYMWLAGNYAATHDVARTAEATGKVLALAPEEPVFLAFCAHSLAVSGKREDALSLLDRVTKLSAKTAVDPWNLAYIHAGLGNKARAVQYLERAIEERSANVQNPNIDFARTLGSYPPYQALVRKLNLPGNANR